MGNGMTFAYHLEIQPALRGAARLKSEAESCKRLCHTLLSGRQSVWARGVRGINQA